MTPQELFVVLWALFVGIPLLAFFIWADIRRKQERLQLSSASDTLTTGQQLGGTMSRVETAVRESMKFDGNPSGYISDIQGPHDDSSLTELVAVVCVDRETGSYSDLPIRRLSRYAGLPPEEFVAKAIELASR